MVANIANVLAAYRRSTEGAIPSLAETDKAGGASFGDTLKTFMTDTVATLREGEKAATAGALGKANLQEVVIAVSKAETMMQTLTALRDRVIGAYKDIISMPV